MAIDYSYGALVTKTGILDDPQAAIGIADEWELYSAALLEETGCVDAPANQRRSVHAAIGGPRWKRLSSDGWNQSIK